jgi:hypothetical protein
MAVARSLFTPSDQAVDLYRMMIKRMDRIGYVDLKGCMEINVEATSRDWDLETINKLMGEIEHASLAFPYPGKTGLIVRLPLASL